MATGHVDDHDDLSTAVDALATAAGVTGYALTDWTIGDPGHIDEHNNLVTALGAIQGVFGTSYDLPPVRFLGDTGHISDHALLEAAVLGNQGAELLLTDAAWFIDAWEHTGVDTITNLGTSGSALNAQSGSTSGSDSNDPLWLEYTSTNYVYLPGIAGNSLTATAPSGTDNYLATKTDNTTTTAAAAPGAFTFTTVGSWKSIALRNSSNVVLTTVNLTGITAPTQTTLTGSGTETWTINRATSGRKTTLVGDWAGGGSLWLFGTDDYITVADHADLDFAASDSFTIMVACRQWATPPGSTVGLMNKLDGSALNGWALLTDTSYLARGLMNGGSYLANPVSAAGTAGALATMGAVRTGSTDLAAFLNGTKGTASVVARPSVSNSLSLLIGTDRGINAANTFAGELVAAAVFRRALTATELATVHTYLSGRTP